MNPNFVQKLINRQNIKEKMKEIKAYGFKSGGSTGSKKQLFLLHPGEVVVPRHMVKDLPNKFDKLKKRKPQLFNI